MKVWRAAESGQWLKTDIQIGCLFLFMVCPLTSGSYLDQRSRTIIAIMQFPSQMGKYYFTVGVRLDEDMQTALTQWAIYLLVVAI